LILRRRIFLRSRLLCENRQRHRDNANNGADRPGRKCERHKKAFSLATGEVLREQLCYSVAVNSVALTNVQAGLCADCQHARQVKSPRGSLFLLCELSATDRNFPKYPRLPVLACSGYLRVDSSNEKHEAP
jgi:hypothetical protein